MNNAYRNLVMARVQHFPKKKKPKLGINLVSPKHGVLCFFLIKYANQVRLPLASDH